MIAKDIINVSPLALIKGASKAIAVAPHIAEPLDNKRINLLSKPTHLPIDKQIKKLNMKKMRPK